MFKPVLFDCCFFLKVKSWVIFFAHCNLPSSVVYEYCSSNSLGKKGKKPICECLATLASGSGNSRMGGHCPSSDPTPSNKHSRTGSQRRQSDEANKPGPSGCGNSRMDPLPAGSATPRNKQSRTGSESVKVSSDDEANKPGPSGCGNSRMGGHCPSPGPLPAGSETLRNKHSRTGSQRRKSDEANKPGPSGCGNSRMDPLPAGSAAPRNKQSRTGSESVTVSSDDEANKPGHSRWTERKKSRRLEVELDTRKMCNHISLFAENENILFCKFRVYLCEN
jgi:hypothetical protein